MTANNPPELTPFAGPEHQPYRLGDGTKGIMLIHGFPGTAAETRTTAELMTQEGGWSAYGLLLPGFGPQIGQLYHYNRHDWLDHARNQWRIVRDGHEQSVLLGFSMGGAIAIALAAELPPDHLVLIAPFHHVPSWVAVVAFTAGFFIRKLHPFRRADFHDPLLRERLTTIMPGINPDDERVQQIVREKFAFHSQTILEIIKLGRDAGLLAGSITAPVTIIQGKDDMVVRPSFTHKLLNKLSGASISYYEIDGEHNIIGQSGTQNRLVVELILQELGRSL